MHGVEVAYIDQIEQAGEQIEQAGEQGQIEIQTERARGPG